MKRMIASTLIGLTVLLAAVCAQAQQLAAHTEVRARLTAPLNTQANRKGDKVAVYVVSPASLAGATLEGQIVDCNGKGIVHSNADLKIRFQTLLLHGSAIAVKAEVRAIQNTRGQLNVDEFGAALNPSAGSLAAQAREHDITLRGGAVYVLDLSPAR